MGLTEFRRSYIKLDKANQMHITPQYAKRGDFNGRELVVQVTDGGEIKDMTGVSLELGWKHETVLNVGLEPFEELDITQGLFKVTYPTEFLNPGRVLCAIRVSEDGQVTNSMNFSVVVEKSPYDDDTIASDNAFTVLELATTEAQQATSSATAATQSATDAAQAANDAAESTKLERKAPVDTFADLATTYPNPEIGWAVFVRNVGTNGEVYRFDGTDWQLIEEFDGTVITEVDNRLTSQLAETAKLSPGKKGILYAGVIRNDGSGWRYITDAVHQNINFSTIDVTVNNEIVVYYTDSKLIGSMVVTPDETLASFGLTCGASVGDNAAFIRAYAPFTGYIDGTGTIIGNQWFAGAYTATPIGDGTGYTIAYDGGANGQEKVLSTNVRDSGTTHNGLDIRAARGGAGSVILRAYHDLYGYVYYDGAAWQVATSCVANVSASFDNATGVLTITHDSMSGGAGYNEFQSVSVSPRKGVSAGLVHPRINSVTQSQVKVEFYDASGTLIMSPTNNMRIYFSRPGFRVPHTWNSGSRAYFDFGQALVRPSNLVSANGNLWLLGLHEAN